MDFIHSKKIVPTIVEQIADLFQLGCCNQERKRYEKWNEKVEKKQADWGGWNSAKRTSEIERKLYQ